MRQSIAPLLPARLNTGRSGGPRLSMPSLPLGLGRGGDLDSRLRKPKLSLDGSLERAYCISCTAPSGWVSAEVVNVATYICPACTERGGGPLPVPRLDI